MDVQAIGEGGLELRDVADVRQKPQLDLAIVRRDQHMAGLGDEGRADLAPFLGAHRDILQVGVVGRQAAGGGGGQGEGGVHPPGAPRDGGDQVVGIGALQLGQLAPVQQHARQFVALGGQVLQHARVRAPGAGGGLLAPGDAHLAEQHLADLLGAAQIERTADQGLRLGFQLDHA